MHVYVQFLADHMLHSVTVIYFWYTTRMQVWPKHLTKAQIKVTVSFAWYVLYSLSLMIALSFLAVTSKDAESELIAYFACEST